MSRLPLILGGAIALGAGAAALAFRGRVAPAAAVREALPEGPRPLTRRVYHRDRLGEMHPRLLALLDAWEQEGTFPVVITPHGGQRTSEEQQAELFAQRVTAAKTLAQTPHGKAPSCALDWAPYRRNADGLYAPDYSDEVSFAELGAFAESRGLEWGGRWRRPDMPHVQVPGWQDYPTVGGGIA